MDKNIAIIFTGRNVLTPASRIQLLVYFGRQVRWVNFLNRGKRPRQAMFPAQNVIPTYCLDFSQPTRLADAQVRSFCPAPLRKSSSGTGEPLAAFSRCEFLAVPHCTSEIESANISFCKVELGNSVSIWPLRCSAYLAHSIRHVLTRPDSRISIRMRTTTTPFQVAVKGSCKSCSVLLRMSVTERRRLT